MLPYRPLGRTGLMVSPICLGTMTWGQQNTQAEAHAQLDAALAAGVNFIDAAEMYPIPPNAATQGRTEQIIGTWLAARGGRDRIVLASKIAGRAGGAWYRTDGRETRLDRGNIVEALEGSLRRLRTDYLDLYQLHWPDRPLQRYGEGGTAYRDHSIAGAVPIEETLAALAEQVQAGKIRHVGLSNETAWGVMRFLAASAAGQLPRVASVQNAYSLINRTFEIGLAEIALREQTGLLAYSPLAQGFLTGKYLNGARPTGARASLFNRAQRYEKPGVDIAIERYVALAAEIGADPAQLALAFVTSREFVTATIIGATTMAQLQTDLGSVDLPITPQIAAQIDAIHQRHQNPAP